jgi:hypothetical protein
LAANRSGAFIPFGGFGRVVWPKRPHRWNRPANREKQACEERVASLFSLCFFPVILLLEILSKSLIPHWKLPFLRNSRPVFLENVPVSLRKTSSSVFLRRE